MPAPIPPGPGMPMSKTWPPRHHVNERWRFRRPGGVSLSLTTQAMEGALNRLTGRHFPPIRPKPGRKRHIGESAPWKSCSSVRHGGGQGKRAPQGRDLGVDKRFGAFTLGSTVVAQ